MVRKKIVGVIILFFLLSTLIPNIYGISEITMKNELLTRKMLADRWQVSGRTIDRLRASGALAGFDLSGGQGRKARVRFKLEDIEKYEEKFRMAPMENIFKEAA